MTQLNDFSKVALSVRLAPQPRRVGALAGLVALVCVLATPSMALAWPGGGSSNTQSSSSSSSNQQKSASFASRIGTRLSDWRATRLQAKSDAKLSLASRFDGKNAPVSDRMLAGSEKLDEKAATVASKGFFAPEKAAVRSAATTAGSAVRSAATTTRTAVTNAYKDSTAAVKNVTVAPVKDAVANTKAAVPAKVTQAKVTIGNRFRSALASFAEKHGVTGASPNLKGDETYKKQSTTYTRDGKSVVTTKQFAKGGERAQYLGIKRDYDRSGNYVGRSLDRPGNVESKTFSVPNREGE